MERKDISRPTNTNTDCLPALHAILLAANACRRMAPPAGATQQPSDTFDKIFDELKKIDALIDPTTNTIKDQPDLWDNATTAATNIKSIVTNIHTTNLTAEELAQIEIQLIDLYSKISNITTPNKIKNDDELRNINSFEYLRNLAILIPESLRNQIGFKDAWDHCQPGQQYNIDRPYGNYYTALLIALEETLNQAKSDADRDPLNKLISAVYLNHNFALERAYLMNREELGKVRQADYKKAEKQLRQKLKEPGHERAHGKNVDSPVGAGSGIGLIISNIAPNFKPMTTTSQPSMVHFAYKTDANPQQLRFGTQGQIIDYKKHVNPIFKRWLQIQEQSQPKRARVTPITHIYFNNLSRVGGSEAKLDIKRKSREDSLTKQLENLEKEHPNIAVVTMPSDGGMMNHHHITKRKQTIKGEEIFQKILAIAEGTSTEPYAKDFYISDNVRQLLFGTKSVQTSKLEELLNNSFTALGFSRDQMLSLSDQQAVYFHFVKFELANYIIEKIQPRTFNFSCKDAIDRGGVSSAYYNLLKSIETGQPLSQHEFECILHGAPILVKGRPMNDHIMLIWNTIDAYLRANEGNKKIPAWLPKWRDDHAAKKELLYNEELDNCIGQLKNYIQQKEMQKLTTPVIEPKFTAEFKQEVASELLTALEEHKKNNKNLRASPCQLTIDRKKYAAMHNGGLYRNIIKPLELNGLLVLRKSSLEASLSPNIYGKAISHLEKIVNRMLASRSDIIAADRALIVCKNLQLRMSQFKTELLPTDPRHDVIKNYQDKLAKIKANLENAKNELDTKKSYSPSRVLSFAPRTHIVSAPTIDQLDAEIAKVLDQRAPNDNIQGSLANAPDPSNETTEDFVKDKARVNFIDIETGIGVFAKKTTIKSVQRMRDTTYKTESYFDPTQLSRFGNNGYIQWAITEIDSFHHTNPMQDKHITISGYPEKFVRFATAYCEIMKIPYTNSVNDYEPTEDDKQMVRKQMAKTSRATINANIGKADMLFKQADKQVSSTLKGK